MMGRIAGMTKGIAGMTRWGDEEGWMPPTAHLEPVEGSSGEEGVKVYVKYWG